MALLAGAHGTTIQRAMIPVVPYGLLWGLKACRGIESMPALPRLLFSAEVLRQLVGFNAQRVRQGMCQRGATTRPPSEPDLPGGSVQEYRQAECVGAGGLVPWGQSRLGEDGGVRRPGHRHGGWQRCGDHRALRWVWPGDPQGAHLRTNGAGCMR
jgi:hypothetical protein